jgi:hypothetical protein
MKAEACPASHCSLETLSRTTSFLGCGHSTAGNFWLKLAGIHAFLCDAGANHGEPYSRQMRCPARRNTTHVRSTILWQPDEPVKRASIPNPNVRNTAGTETSSTKPTSGRSRPVSTRKRNPNCPTWVRRRARRKKSDVTAPPTSAGHLHPCGNSRCRWPVPGRSCARGGPGVCLGVISRRAQAL